MAKPKGKPGKTSTKKGGPSSKSNTNFKSKNKKGGFGGKGKQFKKKVMTKGNKELPKDTTKKGLKEQLASFQEKNTLGLRMILQLNSDNQYLHGTEKNGTSRVLLIQCSVLPLNSGDRSTTQLSTTYQDSTVLKNTYILKSAQSFSQALISRISNIIKLD